MLGLTQRRRCRQDDKMFGLLQRRHCRQDDNQKFGPQQGGPHLQKKLLQEIIEVREGQDHLFRRGASIKIGTPHPLQRMQKTHLHSAQRKRRLQERVHHTAPC